MSTARYIRHNKTPPTVGELPGISKDFSNALSENVEQVLKHVSSRDRATIYTGVAGIGLMNSYLENLAMTSSKHKLVLPKLRPVHDSSRVSFLETSVGPAVLANAPSYLQDAITVVNADTSEDDDGCEVLYGRAGLLYALLRAKAKEPVLLVVKQLIRRGRLGAKRYREEYPNLNAEFPPFMWSWHGKRYLGAAHGVVGILHMLLKCGNNVIQPYLDKILETVEWLVDLQDADGNWPSKAPSSSALYHNDLVQWCHGATGILLLLSSVLQRPGTNLSSTLRDKLHRSIRKGGDLVYSHGLLRKGHGLCHGVSGSVYALLAVSDALDSEELFLRAVHLAHLTLRKDVWEQMRTPDAPWSLYEGMAGMCCAWGELVVRIDKGRLVGKRGIPGYDDI